MHSELYKVIFSKFWYKVPCGGRRGTESNHPNQGFKTKSWRQPAGQGTR